jgi:hypothetical protein
MFACPILPPKKPAEKEETSANEQPENEGLQEKDESSGNQDPQDSEGPRHHDKSQDNDRQDESEQLQGEKDPEINEEPQKAEEPHGKEQKQEEPKQGEPKHEGPENADEDLAMVSGIVLAIKEDDTYERIGSFTKLGVKGLSFLTHLKETVRIV